MNAGNNGFREGLRDGVPIFLGYLAVSFTFGIAASRAGLSIFHSVLMSATNLTSAGQFASLEIIAFSAPYWEMALTQAVINLRYCLMSCVISQKLDPGTVRTRRRLMIAYGITDEIFGISASGKGRLNPSYIFGAISAAAPGWILGTFLGALSGTLLPARALSALSIAIYGMFLAIIIPPARENKILLGIILVSGLFSFAFSAAPLLSAISPGFKIIIPAILISGVAAVLFPVKEAADEQ